MKDLNVIACKTYQEYTGRASGLSKSDENTQWLPVMTTITISLDVWEFLFGVTSINFLRDHGMAFELDWPYPWILKTTSSTAKSTKAKELLSATGRFSKRLMDDDLLRQSWKVSLSVHPILAGV